MERNQNRNIPFFMNPSYNRLTLRSRDYPRLLKEIYDPPPLLYVDGKWPDRWEDFSWMAVVGARKASGWGLQKTREIVSELVVLGFGIVSGLAYGIDGEAHKTCVEKGGRTWGVLGSGIDRVYPMRHLGLAKQMKERGGILSEFPLGTPPNGKHFPQRNRIISGLSHGVVVIEAALKSGSLITARFALEQGREVFVAVPPNNDVCYEGNYLLLDDGATPIDGEYQPRSSSSVAEVSPLLSLLSQPRSLDYLVEKLSQKPQEILPQLMVLESRGLVKKKPGPLWQSL